MHDLLFTLTSSHSSHTFCHPPSLTGKVYLTSIGTCQFFMTGNLFLYETAFHNDFHFPSTSNAATSFQIVVVGRHLHFLYLFPWLPKLSNISQTLLTRSFHLPWCIKVKWWKYVPLLPLKWMQKNSRVEVLCHAHTICWEIFAWCIFSHFWIKFLCTKIKSTKNFMYNCQLFWQLHTYEN